MLSPSQIVLSIQEIQLIDTAYLNYLRVQKYGSNVSCRFLASQEDTENKKKSNIRQRNRAVILRAILNWCRPTQSFNKIKRNFSVLQLISDISEIFKWFKSSLGYRYVVVPLGKALCVDLLCLTVSTSSSKITVILSLLKKNK